MKRGIAILPLMIILLSGIALAVRAAPNCAVQQCVYMPPSFQEP
jgi:hypothetical protein